METPNKRMRPSPAETSDFLSFDSIDNAAAAKYGFNDAKHPPSAPRADRDSRYDRRNALDRPKSKHALPGHSPWILVKTKLGRRFVHNTQTKESFWRIPPSLLAAVHALDTGFQANRENGTNVPSAEDAEFTLKATSKAEPVPTSISDRSRRRRSESLQREDEEAMMAELAAEADHAEEQDVKAVVRTLEPVAGEVGYDSEGSYEYIEVTDSEGEERDGDGEQGDAGDGEMEGEGEEAVEFGEDDIAYQLAAMGEEYGLDPEEYGGDEAAAEEDDLGISSEDAANLFREMLTDHSISPFTPWESLITNSSILDDDRYTVLPSTALRRQVWDAWVRDTAAQIKEERSKTEKQDPKIPFLAFLADHATPKLYWPEFKRKFRKDAVMQERELADREREKLYRDFVNRLKLSEEARRKELVPLLKSGKVKKRDVEGDVRYWVLPAAARDSIVKDLLGG